MFYLVLFRCPVDQIKFGLKEYNHHQIARCALTIKMQ